MRALDQARTRVRLHVEQLADASLRGCGFYTGKNRDWEMVRRSTRISFLFFRSGRGVRPVYVVFNIRKGLPETDGLGEDISVLKALEIPVENNINNGGFNVEKSGVTILQPYFRHVIKIDTYDYQISFDYRNTW